MSTVAASTSERRWRAPALIALLALVAALSGLFATAAQAHPLGNFTTNQLVQVEIGDSQATVSYALDQAEIPTFQELQRQGVDSADALSAEQIEALRTEIADAATAGLALTVDGETLPTPSPDAATIDFPEGQGGLDLVRFDADFTYELPDGAESVALSNGVFAGKQGWNAIQILPGEGTDVVSDVPATDVTDGLSSYPVDLRESPSDVREASFQVSPGDGGITAPAGLQGGESTTDRAGDGFAGALTSSDAGGWGLLLLLVAAFGWGALHALSPGHGKAMVAGYLVGARGTPRHAFILGGTVTITHTISVFALGLITLAASAYILPEDLYPWLSIASGLMVIAIGLTVMRTRYRRWRQMRELAVVEAGMAAPAAEPVEVHAGAPASVDEHQHEGERVLALVHEHGGSDALPDLDHAHSHSHSHSPGDLHGPGDNHAHGHDHAHDHEGHSHSHDHGDGHSHSHMPEGPITMRSLLALGVSGGLVPCPSALVVLIAAISQHRIGFGMVLILAFSLGLAATMTAIGLSVIWGGRAVRRFRPDRQLFGARFVGALPAISASIIVVAGVLISLRALPELSL